MKNRLTFNLSSKTPRRVKMSTTPVTAPLAGVGETASPREVCTVAASLIWTCYQYLYGAENDILILWGIFFIGGLVLDTIDTGWRFHYRKEWASQILWWLQPHYVVAAILGVIIDWVYPINLTLSFIVTIVVGVIISIPIERYYVSLNDSE